jgi:hypothetical protein
LKLVIEKYSAPLFAYYGYAKGECPSRDEEPAILLVNIYLPVKSIS